MSNNLLKIGGISPENTAVPFQVGSLGALKTNQYPSTSFFLGAVDEPTTDNHVGAYGVFGLEVLRTSHRGGTLFNRYHSTFLAKKGKYYYISTNVDGSGSGAVAYYYINMVDVVSQDVVTKEIEGVASGTYRPLTVIDLGTNIAVVDQLGVGSIYSASTLKKVGDTNWDVVAYNKDGNELTSNVNTYPTIQVRGASSTFVLSAHRLTEYSDDGTKKTHKTVESWIGTGGYIRTIRNFDANNKYFFITASISGGTFTEGYAIIIVKRSDLSLVKVIQDVSELPKTVVPTAFASDSDEIFYTIEGVNGNMYKWVISGNTATVDPDIKDSLNVVIGENITSYFTHHKNGLTLIRTLGKVYLYDFNNLELKWVLAMPTTGPNAACWFDGFGHVLFGDSENNLLLTSQYLQVQGYGVKD